MGASAQEQYWHYDPHYWMDPASVPTMLDNLVEGLVQIMPEWEPLLRTNTGLAADLVERELLDTYQGRDGGGLTHRELITFHDGFQYFARAFDLELLAAIEEEAGNEASAKEIVRSPSWYGSMIFRQSLPRSTALTPPPTLSDGRRAVRSGCWIC